MQAGIHPRYHHVVFQDRSTGDAFLTRSTMTSEEKVTWEDGKTYPLVRVDVSRYSHPFWTGRGRVVDTEGRVEAFRRRYGRGVVR
ncbi:MAG TPA: type B 50S ribosomal protein L31 [Nocardioidaceae bacterium]|nr:type B 50S ribosomal protein L31 [Nocardioidaceae bacterium]